jgi:hypothetical protein
LTTAKESFDLLEAFFIGRALAETINERLGTLAADTFAEIGKLEAEIRRSISEFESEVVERGRREMMSTIIPDGMSPSAPRSSGGMVENEEFVPADLGEAVDDLRAEIAATRALIQQIKPKFMAQP